MPAGDVGSGITGRVGIMIVFIFRLFKKCVVLAAFSTFFLWSDVFASGCLARPVSDRPVVTPKPPVIDMPKHPVIVAPSIPLIPVIEAEKKSNSDVADVIAKAHQNKIGAGESRSGNIETHLMPVLGNSDTTGKSLGSIKDHGVDSLVAQAHEDKGKVQACSQEVQLSTGKTATVDLHGDNLIHLGASDKTDKTDKIATVDTRGEKAKLYDAGNIHEEHGHVTITAHEVKQVLNNVISMSDTVEAKEMCQGKNGDVILHSNDGINVVDTNSNNRDGINIENTGIHGEGHDVVNPNQDLTVGAPSITNGDGENVTMINNTPVINNSGVDQGITVSVTPTEVITPTVTPENISTPTIESSPVINNPPVATSSVVVTPSFDVTVTTPIETTVPTTSSFNASESTISLNQHSLSSPDVNTEINKIDMPGSDAKQGGLIVVGQIVKLAGKVTEIDENGQQHRLFMGSNVHLGSKYIASNSSESIAQVRYFNGDIDNVLK